MCIFKELEKEVEKYDYGLQKTNERLVAGVAGSSSHKTQNLITA